LANQRHTAGCPAVEVRITYPFHPRSGEIVAVVGSKRYAGADHLVVRQPDRTLALLPVWMTEPAAAACRLVASPQLSLARLAEVRALVDLLLAASGQSAPGRTGAAHEDHTASSLRRNASQSAGSVRRESDASSPDARAAGQADPLLQSLLTEAAGLGQPDTAPHASAKEDGDDQDHV
jgi:hypothetical protein